MTSLERRILIVEDSDDLIEPLTAAIGIESLSTKFREALYHNDEDISNRLRLMYGKQIEQATERVSLSNFFGLPENIWVDFAVTRGCALKKIEQNRHHHIVTDICFPPKDKTVQVDSRRMFDETLRLYNEENGTSYTVNQIIGLMKEESDPDVIAKIRYLRKCTNECLADTVFSLIQGSLIPRIEQPTQHAQCTNPLVDLGFDIIMRADTNGIDIAKTAHSLGVSYTIFTGHSGHNYPGPIEVINEGLADPRAVVGYDSPTAVKEGVIHVIPMSKRDEKDPHPREIRIANDNRYATLKRDFKKPQDFRVLLNYLLQKT